MIFNKSDVQWHIIYDRLATLLFEFANGKLESAGIDLFELLTSNSQFKEYNPWISNLNDESFKGFDPIQLFASFNGSRMKDETRLQRINILFSILEDRTVLQEFKKIDFEGCPTPVVIKMISPRNSEDQKEIWKVFINLMKEKNKELDSNLFEKVKKWYGVDVVSFTQFLFWVDSENFLPLDKNTVNLLLRLKKNFYTPGQYKGISATT